MATALPAPSSNKQQWWPRISSNKVPSGSSSYRPDPYPRPGRIPKSASALDKPALMTPVTNPKPTSSNAFTSSSKPSSSKFNFASVIGFGSKSKKQQALDIQDPPSHVRSLPTPKSSSHTQFGSPSQRSNPRLSRGVASSTSGTSRASTDGPLTPADDTMPSIRGSYQQSLMTLTDDPFAAPMPFSDRRASSHSVDSNKGISKRLLLKSESKTAKTTTRLPVGEGHRQKDKDSRDRSLTLPSRARTATDASGVYQPLRAFEPPWAPVSPPESPPFDSANQNRLAVADTTVRGIPSGSGMLRKSKSAKPALPWAEARARTAPGPSSPRVHQRNKSSSSLSKEYLLEGSSRNLRSSPAPGPSTIRVPTSPSKRTSTASSNYGVPVFPTSGQTTHLSPDVNHIPDCNKTPPKSVQITPTVITQFPRSSPRPPPTHELPPTPHAPGHSPPILHPLEQPLRRRSGTVASTSAVSFASSLSSLSFNSRPSPHEAPIMDAYNYPSLIGESLPVPGAELEYERRGSNSGSSLASESETKANEGINSSPADRRSPVTKIVALRSDVTPKQTKSALPVSRPLPSPPVSAPVASSQYQYPRERTMSATSSNSLTVERPQMLRKQRSFHNTSLQAPAPPPPRLRHYNSFDPPPADPMHSPLPPPPPPRDLPPPPPSSMTLRRGSTGKEGKEGKDTLASPRRRLFSPHKHDRERERERKPAPEAVEPPALSEVKNSGFFPTQHHSSSMYDEGSSEPAHPMHDVAQHIVPPAELLRLGAAWERESEGDGGVRIAKGSWSSRDTDISRASSSSKFPLPPRSAGSGMSALSASSTGSKLPRTASLFSKASPSSGFPRARAPMDMPFPSTCSPVPPESYTSLSPPPRRPQRTPMRPPTATSLQTPSGVPRRTLSNATTVSATSGSSSTSRRALIERKPSFLDMTTRRSVQLDVPDDSDEPEPRDSFLELSRGMDSIDTIRESEASFIQ